MKKFALVGASDRGMTMYAKPIFYQFGQTAQLVGIEPVTHPRGWPLYHQVLAAGSKIMIEVDHIDTKRDSILPLKTEFGTALKRFIIKGTADRWRTLKESSINSVFR